MITPTYMPLIKRGFAAAIASAAIILTSASPSIAASAEKKLVVTGASTVAPVLGEIAKRYESLHSDVRIDVQTGGSARGLADARSGLADIGMVSRALKEEEKDLIPFTIGLDGVAIIVHADNPIAELTRQQIIDIYVGKINNWSEVGGADEEIVVINKAEGRSTLELFLEYFDLKSPDIQADIIAGDNEQDIKAVAGNPFSIGYVSIGNAEYDVKAGVPIRLLPLEGVPATRETVAAERFPLRRPLNLVVPKQPEGLILDFITYARSPDVRDIVESFYYVAPPGS
jgi:phosphate transport system substrate-binding protein